MYTYIYMQIHIVNIYYTYVHRKGKWMNGCMEFPFLSCKFSSPPDWSGESSDVAQSSWKRPSLECEQLFELLEEIVVWVLVVTCSYCIKLFMQHANPVWHVFSHSSGGCPRKGHIRRGVNTTQYTLKVGSYLQHIFRTHLGFCEFAHGSDFVDHMSDVKNVACLAKSLS